MSIAVFGGSFNPPTIAHINLAKEILKKVDDVEKVVFVPVSTKYNKKGIAPDETRLSMLQKICEKEEGIEVSSIELDSPKQPYTLETLEALQKQNPEKEIYFILGTDNLKELETWYKVEELLEKFKVLVLKRDNDNIEEIVEKSKILSKYKNQIIELKSIEQIDLSASYVREKIQKGEAVTGLVPKEIEKEVEQIL